MRTLASKSFDAYRGLVFDSRGSANFSVRSRRST